MCNTIYCITSKRDYKKYIGKTNNLPARIKQHKMVETGKHYNSYFQNYYNKYFKGVPVDIYVYDKQKRFIEKVHGMRECAKKYSINPNTINTSCNRGGLVFGKYCYSRTEITEPKENQHGL